MAEIEAHITYAIECPAPGCPTPKEVVRDGWKNGNQRYECRGCGNHFFAEGKPRRKQFTAQQIADAVDSYYSGMSYKQVAEGLEDTYEVPEPAKSTVYAWVKAYTRLAQQYMRGEVGSDGTEATATGKRIRAQVGDHWVADEMQVHVGGKRLWLWNVMDRDTRYILAARLGPRSLRAGIALFREAQRNAAKEPQTITTDGLVAYEDAIKTVFHHTQHIVSEGIHEEINNNLSERLQGSFRQRTKTQRGLEQRLTGQEYVDGWVLDYNFMKDHEAHEGGSPAEAAGVAQQVPWDDWEDIVRLGGEVAEPRLIRQTPVPKKPGPKPQLVEEAVNAFQQQKKASKVKRPANPRFPVAPYWKEQAARGTRGGRGRAEVGATKKQ